MRTPIHTIGALLVAAALLPQAAAPAHAGQAWSTYLLPAYDYTVQLPDDWRVFAPGIHDAELSYDHTQGFERYHFYARYHFDDPTQDIYAAEVGAPYQRQDFALDNGQQATLITHDACRSVVWVYRRVERFVGWCGDDPQQQALFEQIARRIDAPSRTGGAPVALPPNPPLTAPLRDFLAAFRRTALPAAPWPGWADHEAALWLPESWRLSHDDENGTCGLAVCTPVVATPLDSARGQGDNQGRTGAWVARTYMRLDVAADPYGTYLLDPSYYGLRIRLGDGRPALLFMRDEGDFQTYRIIRVEGDYAISITAQIGADPSAAAYRADMAKIFRSARWQRAQ